MKYVLTMLCCMLLTACSSTHRMWKTSDYTEQIYGAHLVEVDDQQAIIIRGRENQYMLDHNPEWDALLASGMDAVFIDYTSATQVRNRVEFSFIYRWKNDDENHTITGVAQIIDNDIIDYEQPTSSQGIFVQVKVAPSSDAQARRILATPLSVSLDIFSYTTLAIAGPVWIGFIPFIGW